MGRGESTNPPSPRRWGRKLGAELQGSWGLFAVNRRWGEGSVCSMAGVEGKGRQAQSEAQHRWGKQRKRWEATLNARQAARLNALFEIGRDS